MMVVEIGGSAGGDTRLGKSAVIAVGKKCNCFASKKIKYWFDLFKGFS